MKVNHYNFMSDAFLSQPRRVWVSIDSISFVILGELPTEGKKDLREVEQVKGRKILGKQRKAIIEAVDAFVKLHNLGTCYHSALPTNFVAP